MTGFQSKRASAQDKLKEQDMSKMAELDWQIEYMACEDGMSAVDIAQQLDCPIDIVNAWFKGAGIWDEEPLSPYATNNS